MSGRWITTGHGEPDTEVLTESALARAQATIAIAMDRAEISKADLARGMDRPRSFITRMLSGSHNLTVKTMANALLTCGFEIEFGMTPIKWNWASEPQIIQTSGVPAEGTPVLAS